MIDSCENRCGTYGGTPESTDRIACDCDGDCVERNTCCPDYIGFCVLGKLHARHWMVAKQQRSSNMAATQQLIFDICSWH